MAAEEMTLGDGISDDSSFYGDEDEQERQLALCDMSDAKLFWAARDKDLNTITLAARRQTSRKTMPDEKASTFSNPLQSTAVVLSAGSATVPTLFNMAALDRKAMEQERLSRLGKRRRDPSPEQEPTKFELFNPRAGHTDSWQLGESVDDFIRRLSPTTTSIATCPWIWAENPHRNPRDVSAASRVDEFTSRGMELLANSLKTRQRIQAKGSEGHKAVLNKQLKQESNDLQQRIADLAAEHHICTGKWMLFPKSTDVTRIWKQVVQGLIDNRLGPTAKVASHDGNDEQLICVYTKDFRDIDDVVRVLRELEALGILDANAGRTIYYKHDAFTYLDLKSETARQFGLNASLYNSRTMLAAVPGLQKSSTMPRRKQTTLNRFF